MQKRATELQVESIAFENLFRNVWEILTVKEQNSSYYLSIPEAVKFTKDKSLFRHETCHWESNTFEYTQQWINALSFLYAIKKKIIFHKISARYCWNNCSRINVLQIFIKHTMDIIILCRKLWNCFVHNKYWL